MKKNVRTPIIHEPSTQEIFSSLTDMPIYSRILLRNTPSKPYAAFVNWLLENDFFNARDRNITIKELSSLFKTDPTKISRWLHDIYNDIFDLNSVQPTLFQKSGKRIALAMKNFDNYSLFNLELPMLPREFEKFNFFFMQAKLGTSSFWVESIEHIVSANGVEVNISLNGNILNRYREFITEKAMFYRLISIDDRYNKSSIELDELLKGVYHKYS